MKPHWRRLLLFGPYALIVFIGFVGFRSVESEAHQRCLNRQDDREVLRQVVDISTTPSGAASIDLTQVPGFTELDATTQTFIRNLSDGIASSAPPARKTLHDQLLAKLPPISC